MTDIIAVHGLRKAFGVTQALAGLDLTVSQGEVHGFLGPNGAGKSTTLRVLLGLVRKDAGEATVFGEDPWSDAVILHRRLAYVPGDVTLWPNLTGGEVIDLLGRLRGGQDAVRRNALIERFELDPTKKSRAYSKGNRQKVGLIAALASEAPLLLLDEPTSGLDPLMEAVFREVVAELRQEGTTILLSSHILSEVEHLADAVTIIREGVTVEAGRLADLRHLSRTRISAVTTGDPSEVLALPGVHDGAVSHPGESFSLTAHVDADALDGAMSALARLGLTSLTAAPPTLEELFLAKYVATPAEEPVSEPDEDTEPADASTEPSEPARS